jgi:hypothetical protein
MQVQIINDYSLKCSLIRFRLGRKVDCDFQGIPAIEAGTEYQCEGGGDGERCGFTWFVWFFEQQATVSSTLFILYAILEQCY